MATINFISGLLSGTPTDFLNPYSLTLGANPIFDASSGQRVGRLVSGQATKTNSVRFAISAVIGIYSISRYYSLPLSGNQNIGSGGIGASVTGKEDLSTENAEWETAVFIITANNTVRGNIWRSSGAFPEMDTADSTTTASGNGAVVSAQHGDRLAFEVYYNKTAAKLTTSAELGAALNNVCFFTLQPAEILFQPEGGGPVVSELPIGALYLNPSSGRRTLIGSGIAGMIPIKINPATGQRGIDSGFGKYLVVSNGLTRAVSGASG